MRYLAVCNGAPGEGLKRHPLPRANVYAGELVSWPPNALYKNNAQMLDNNGSRRIWSPYTPRG
jgi:hypothetical protein